MNLRVGFVGCGWISTYQIEGWRQIPDVEVVAVCDREAARAHRLALQYGIPWSGDDAARMMEKCKLDILDIATPPRSHKDLALSAVERGIHVLCQKPAALTLADATEMIRCADQHRVVLYINEMLRFCPWFQQTHKLLQENSVGRVVFARLFSRTHGFLKVGPSRNLMYGFREFLKWADRGIMLEETIHFLDVMRYFFGTPKTIYAITEHLSPLLKGEDVATIMLRYEGMTAVIEDSWSAHGPARSGLEVEGAEGAVFLSHGKALELYSGQQGGIEETWDYSGTSWDEQRPKVFASLYKDFLQAISSEGDRTAQAKDNLETLRLTLAAYESAEAGKEVKL